MNRKKVEKQSMTVFAINKKFWESKQNDKNNLSKKIINLIQAFDHSSAIPLGTGLYQHISPVVTLQGNIALDLWWQSKLFNKEIQVSVMSSSSQIYAAVYICTLLFICLVSLFSIRVPPNE